MNESYFVLTPLVVLAVLLLFRFVGCGSLLTVDDTGVETKPGPTGEPVADYPGTVLKDAPISYWRLQEKHAAEPPSGPFIQNPNVPVAGGQAKDERNTNQGTYKTVIVQPPAPPPPPLLPDSPAAPGTLTLESAGLLELPGQQSTSAHVDGGYVEVPWSLTLATESFTIEALVRPDWPATELGLYRTVVAFSTVDLTSTPKKAFGFGMFAGPTPGVSNSPDVWQVWLADGTTFKPIVGTRDLTPVDFTKINYLAVTYDASTKKLNMYVYVESIDMDSGPAHPVNDVIVTAPYKPVNDQTQSLLIGMHRTPVGSAIPLYHPFKGRIQEVAIYNKALTVGRCPISHVCAGMKL